MALWWGSHAMPPRSIAARAPVPTVGHCWPMLLQETFKHSKAGLAQSHVGFPGPGSHTVLFDSSEHLRLVWGLILNMISPLQPYCCGFSFALGHGVSFFGGIQHSTVDGFSMVCCNFWVLTGEDQCMSFYSTILHHVSTSFKRDTKVIFLSVHITRLFYRFKKFPSVLKFCWL